MNPPSRPFGPTSNDVLFERIDSISRDMTRRFDDVAKRLDRIEVELGDDYVTQRELAPIKAIVYGLVATILIAFLYIIIFKVGWSASSGPS